MHLSHHAEQLLISASTRTTYTGAGVAAGAKAAEKTGLSELLSISGPEVVNACALLGVSVGAVGLVMQGVFMYLRHRRETRESQWRMSGGVDRRSEPR